MNAPAAILMGPQRLAPIVDQALDRLGVRGKVAIITAGWQEREAEDDELEAALGGRPGVNLMLHARGDAAYRDDQELFTSHRAKQDELRHLQELYRRRLTHTMAAARQMQSFHEDDAADAPPALVTAHLSSAIDAVRRLDDEHTALVHAIETEFETSFRPTQRPAVMRHRREIDAILSQCSAVAIAGGHVPVLLNKLRLFDLQGALAALPVVAWSAGAMVLTERIVLFHDSPPQGRGYAELLGQGLSLVPGVVALPHARRRLLLSSSRRVAMLARRFAPATCVALDERCYVAFHKGHERALRAGPLTRTLTTLGTCVPMDETPVETPPTEAQP
jgi:peptidase E